VSGRGVVGVAGLVDLFVSVGECELHLALDHVAHVLALAAFGGTITHGQGARAATSEETLPSTADASLPRPREPSTTSPAPSSSQMETMYEAGAPTVARVRGVGSAAFSDSRSSSCCPVSISSPSRRSCPTGIAFRPGAPAGGGATCTKTSSSPSLLASSSATFKTWGAASLSSRQQRTGPIGGSATRRRQEQTCDRAPAAARLRVGNVAVRVCRLDDARGAPCGGARLRLG
jgi:hypothetical protein